MSILVPGQSNRNKKQSYTSFECINKAGRHSSIYVGDQYSLIYCKIAARDTKCFTGEKQQTPILSSTKTSNINMCVNLDTDTK